ncbi:MAG: hypothetical protein KF845_10815 [Cyclobacteriaceae bacterium]|nr:hypothetical protein [Cyclobacteriaceae bacterium]
MKLVTRNDIENWADTALSKSDMPYLISMLVRATTPKSTQLNFPSGSTAFVGGWDGEVNCQEDTAYVPKGISLWEFGTESDNKGKADDDYDKRKADPLGYNPKDCVFIFVTLRFWKQKDKWIKAKQAENFWKDVKVYDSSNIEQWLYIAVSVSGWFADYLRKAPLDGVDIAEQFWKYWSEFRNIKLSSEVITSGRKREQEAVFNFLEATPNITSVKAASKNEAIAFIIASAKLFPVNELERFFSRTLVVHTEAAYKTVSTNFVSSLILIPTFKNKLPLYSAVSNNHHVIVPLGGDDDFDHNPITLPIIDRDGQINALISSGITKEDAEKFSRESARNVTTLKKLLGFPHSKAKWVEKENIREIIPALLLGRWNETFVGDIELIEKFSEQKYADYLVTLNKWKNFEESPIIQIGETWRLTSPIDLWTNFSSQLIPKDFQNIHECFSLAFKNGNPIIEPEDKNSFAAYFNKRNKYSNWSREGLTQSLILVGRLNGIKVPNLDNPQNWVDNIIFDLLNNASGEMWVSIDHELPLISEASPESFLKAVKNSLAKEQPEIMDMFKEEDGFLHKTSHHTGLLWALENLAWFPEYLRDVSLILLKLSRLDPGGSLSNRPLNSISEIFKPWHYQTFASYDERMEILKYVTEKESGWNLLIRMLPDHHGIAHPTHKMRWRMFDKNINLTYTYQEIWNTHSAVIEMLINLFDNDEEKFSQLIKETTNLSPNDRKRVLDWADEVYPNIKQEKFSTWETIRGILNHHRSHPDTDWALPESELLQLESLYRKLQPTDTINRYIWLFNDHFPSFPEGLKENRSNEFEKRYEQQQKRIDEERKNAVTAFLKEKGINQTLELRKQVKEVWVYGDTLARVVVDKNDILLICECLHDNADTIRFAQNFIYRKSIIENFEWIKQLYSVLQENKFSDIALSNFLILLNQNQELWDFISSLGIEIQNEYWKNVVPHFYYISDNEKVIGLEMLLKHKRFFSAIDVTSHFAKVIPSNLLSEMLRKAGTEEASETPRYRGYEIERIFEELDRRTDIEKSTLIHLEWLYLPLLDSYGTRRNPKTLEEELANNPEFFIEVLKWIYVPEDKTLLEKEREGTSDEAIQNRARQAYHLLHSWKKIPGMKDDNSIDETELKEWITKTRTLAKTVSRLEVADSEIGKVLAEYPENVQEWPQEKIFQVIEEINTDSLKSGYSSTLFNKRSFSSRAVFEGGNIEREKAAYFEKLENDFKNKYPNVAEIFKHMKQGYLADAKRMDERAERDKLEY